MSCEGVMCAGKHHPRMMTALCWSAGSGLPGLAGMQWRFFWGLHALSFCILHGKCVRSASIAAVQHKIMDA